MSETAMFLADKDDGLGDIRSILKEEMGKHHAEHINKMLLDKATAAGNDFESLDRIHWCIIKCKRRHLFN